MTISTVLIVDDDFICNMEICSNLRDAGFEAAPAYCAASALEALGGHARLSALVTDIELGDGPDGYEVARRARAAFPGLPVVYVSGTLPARHRAEGVHGSTFISKPFAPRQIVDALCGDLRFEAA